MNAFRRDYKQGGAQAGAQHIMSSDSLSYLSRSFHPSVAGAHSDPSYSLYLDQQQWDVAFDVLFNFNSPSAVNVGDMRGSLLYGYDAFPFPEGSKTVVDLDSMSRSSQFWSVHTPRRICGV